MNKKYYCCVCGAKSCTFSVKDSKNKPFACPFDKRHNAEWKEVKNQNVSNYVADAKRKSQMFSTENKKKKLNLINNEYVYR